MKLKVKKDLINALTIILLVVTIFLIIVFVSTLPIAINNYYFLEIISLFLFGFGSCAGALSFVLLIRRNLSKQVDEEGLLPVNKEVKESILKYGANKYKWGVSQIRILAKDKNVLIRREIAKYHDLPEDVILKLENDKDELVREIIRNRKKEI